MTRIRKILMVIVAAFILSMLIQTEEKIIERKVVEWQTIKLQQADMFVAECTAYTAGYESTGKYPDNPAYGITASGKTVRKGMVAADTRFLPFGTKIYIEGLGIFIVEDTGGDIKGNRIDIYYDNLNEAIKFGRQTRKVIVLDKV